MMLGHLLTELDFRIVLPYCFEQISRTRREYPLPQRLGHDVC
jgi:hypothetical protein